MYLFIFGKEKNIIYLYNILLHLLKFDKQYVYYSNIFLINIFVAKCDNKYYISYNILSLLQNCNNFATKGFFFLLQNL